MTLTPMQQAAASAIQQNNCVQLLSPTGSGKTLAFLLPTIERLVADDCVQAVVVVPSRELALQTESVFREQMREQKLTFRGMSLYGGRPTMDEHRVLREVHPNILFSTPGRLLDHIGKNNVDVSRAQILIVDEYDKCLEMGFRDEMDAVADAFRTCRQIVMTSATATTESSRLQEGRRFTILDYLDENADLAERLSIHAVPSSEKDKLTTLGRLLSYIGDEQSIVFVAHRESTERIGKYLAEHKFSSVVYHGGMEQERRERALYRYRSGSATILVSTDLAARGLDIPTVRHIIHYHLPADEATFTHRSGRTARWDACGKAYLIVGPEERLPEFLDEENTVELSVDEVKLHATQPKWTLLYIGRGKKDKLSKADVLGFLCKKGGLNTKQIGRIDLAPHAAYVAVHKDSVRALLSQISGEKIKGMKTLIEPLRH